MARRALIEHRPWLLASLAASASYYFLAEPLEQGIYAMAWKGLGVGFLAVYAGFRGRGPDGMLIAAAMAFCALADVVLEFSFLVGAGLFGVAHVLAVALYLRNRRPARAASQSATGWALFIGTPVITALITWPRENWHLAALYAVLLGAMAGAAWTSRFPRYRVGTGAVLFVVSDFLIFAREAGSLDPDFTAWLIWPLYYIGQLLIVTGVVQTLRHGTRGEGIRG